MEWNIVLSVIFGAAAVVGGIETTYQLYKLTVMDATARGLKHPKLLGLLSANGNNSSGLLLYLIGRRRYPVQSMDEAQQALMEKSAKLTYSYQNHCASSRSVYLSRRLDSL